LQLKTQRIISYLLINNLFSVYGLLSLLTASEEPATIKPTALSRLQLRFENGSRIHLIDVGVCLQWCSLCENNTNIPFSGEGTTDDSSCSLFVIVVIY